MKTTNLDLPPIRKAIAAIEESCMELDAEATDARMLILLRRLGYVVTEAELESLRNS